MKLLILEKSTGLKMELALVSRKILTLRPAANKFLQFFFTHIFRISAVASHRIIHFPNLFTRPLEIFSRILTNEGSET